MFVDAGMRTIPKRSDKTMIQPKRSEREKGPRQVTAKRAVAALCQWEPH